MHLSAKRSKGGFAGVSRGILGQSGMAAAGIADADQDVGRSLGHNRAREVEVLERVGLKQRGLPVPHGPVEQGVEVEPENARVPVEVQTEG
jgi:hypothetical protein